MNTEHLHDRSFSAPCVSASVSAVVVLGRVIRWICCYSIKTASLMCKH